MDINKLHKLVTDTTDKKIVESDQNHFGARAGFSIPAKAWKAAVQTFLESHPAWVGVDENKIIICHTIEAMTDDEVACVLIERAYARARAKGLLKE
jgi:hypothetical protein